ncbi:MAG: putative glycoside hydrolase [bacterium]|nr:putative glycoside hydrolase [bacterium]
MRRWLWGIFLFLCLAGCSTIMPLKEKAEETKTGQEKSVEETSAAQETETVSVVPEPVKVKGIYLTAGVAGSGQKLDTILENIKKTEINAVVIDVKDDNGRITFSMETPIVNEIDACQVYIEDVNVLMKRLKDMGIYTIARVVAFRDPYLAEKKPEWSLHDADGNIHRDASGHAWVNPYKREVWDYLVEVAREAGNVGFDEVQFDYIRFATDKTMQRVVFDEADVQGRSKTDVITEFIAYAYEQLQDAGIFVSADVFGTIIGSAVDAKSVGQIYEDMAEHLDYICPMIYPSHYGDGNFGLDHPDLHPYETVLGALKVSDRVLQAAARGEKTIMKSQDETGTKDGTQETAGIFMDEVKEASLDGRRPHVLAAEIEEEMAQKEAARRERQKAAGREVYHQAKVRPWLQDFTASYLKYYKTYGPEEIRAQIQAVYDAGYEEWILWNASNNYTWDGLLAAE